MRTVCVLEQPEIDALFSEEGFSLILHGGQKIVIQADAILKPEASALGNGAQQLRDPFLAATACDKCGRVCRTQRALSTHRKRAHHIESPYGLKLRARTQKRGNKAPAKVAEASNGKVYWCPKNCGESFKKVGNRDNHLASVHGVTEPV